LKSCWLSYQLFNLFNHQVHIVHKKMMMKRCKIFFSTNVIISSAFLIIHISIFFSCWVVIDMHRNWKIINNVCEYFSPFFHPQSIIIISSSSRFAWSSSSSLLSIFLLFVLLLHVFSISNLLKKKYFTFNLFTMFVLVRRRRFGKIFFESFFIEIESHRKTDKWIYFVQPIESWDVRFCSTTFFLLWNSFNF
jgi:hypothetical protein